MPTAYLNPGTTITNNNWDSSDLTELAQGETSNIWATTANSSYINVRLSDFDNTGVASINSIQIIIVGAYLARSGSWTARTRIDNSTPSTYYLEDLVLPAAPSPQTVVGTVRTTSDGSTAWTDSDLDGMQIQAFDNTGAGTLGRISQFYIKVDYTEVSGYSNNVNGVASANIGKVKGVATASIDKIIGV